MILLVNDANIFIDLLKINLLSDFFQLPYEFHITDMVAAEVHEENRDELAACFDEGSLHKKTFQYEELMEIQLIQVKYQRLSVPDCSCLFHAQKTAGRLLTGDAALRRSAEQNNIKVHGILWVFDQLVEHQLISPLKAHDKLDRLSKTNPRLPANECKKRLKKWKQG